MENKSGINPRGHRVLILPKEVEEKTASGIVIHTVSQLEREEMAQMYGVVVAVGNTAWKDQPAPFAEVGDNVIFAKYSGHVFQGNDGQKYRLINDLDIVATHEGIK
jgi:chaperonin GroES